MSRKDYQEIAKIFRQRYEIFDLLGRENLTVVQTLLKDYLTSLLKDLIVVFQKENKEFDETKFLIACGYLING
jgi:hypothetical protein